MNLPNYTNFEPFNRLRGKMKATHLGHFSSKLGQLRRASDDEQTPSSDTGKSADNGGEGKA